MKTRGTLFFHGYGVRGGIWRAVVAAIGTDTGETRTPDLNASDIEELITVARGRAKRFSLEIDGPVLLIGHSLGAVLAALTADSLGPQTIGGAVLIAPPYGERERAPGALVKLLLRHRLVPPFLLRPRFFSPQTPVRIQKEVFAGAVAEAPALRELSLAKRFFHTDRLTGPLPVPSLVLASRADRIVPSHQSEAFGQLLHSEIVVLPEADGVGHDDFFASPTVASQTAETIRNFAKRL